MDDKPHHRTEQRLCYFCQSPGPEFQEIKTEKTQKCSQIWICNNCKGKLICLLNFWYYYFCILEKKNLTSSGYSGTGSGSDGGPSDGESSTDSDIIDSDKYLKMLQNQVFKHKSYLKNCWSELRWALDLLYKVIGSIPWNTLNHWNVVDIIVQAQNDMKVTQAIADLIPRQNELEVYCRTLCKEDSVQLLERLDQQCRSYIVQSKRKLFGVAQQKAPQPYEINVSCFIDNQSIDSQSWNTFLERIIIFFNSVFVAISYMCLRRLGKVSSGKSSSRNNYLPDGTCLQYSLANTGQMHLP